MIADMKLYIGRQLVKRHREAMAASGFTDDTLTLLQAESLMCSAARQTVQNCIRIVAESYDLIDAAARLNRLIEILPDETEGRGQ